MDKSKLVGVLVCFILAFVANASADYATQIWGGLGAISALTVHLLASLLALALLAQIADQAMTAQRHD